MPIDIPKHPSMYPIWMRQAIEQALDDLGTPVFAVEVEDAAHERSLRRNFRAYVKALRRQPVPQWDGADHSAFKSCTYKLLRKEHGLTTWLELLATAVDSQAMLERKELEEQLRGSTLAGIWGKPGPASPDRGK